MMTREKVIAELRKYFDIAELVCDHTFQRFGEQAWQFLDTDTLRVLLVVRKQILKVPLICNAGASHQRGLRCNLCAIVRNQNRNYLSAHIQGKGFDLICKEYTAAQMRKMIAGNQDLLPVPVRMESGVTWLHIDTYDPSNGKNKITFFE